ncbi:MAG: carbamoyl-phosphate synthase subunit L [Hyphomonas sp. BRH_c22]|uniref:acetyl/propionyl/methylcrotonyl-CoA carboxylase subunit alpha n=1 Tax=Hyphomonas sp. BRH_c22 TaxID=1629710 RepID=UPI0005F22287|nr:biotin carboxylase N-terminal domain-containing protein [Hyphomonas sp. BRH_c22]KJS35316.1 MAG: carbamoyl-phosphate synthase subunit L [Hyphomonas sp. BRH_c22]
MIKSLLIANRGEIACRIMATCRDMGIRTIAVYSDADARAKHVREADEAVHIGPASAADSYLRGDRILGAAKATGADAIHPGYGFLSENAEFAEDVRNAGLIWVGPPPSAIRAMGLKDEAKRLAEEAGVPVLPGYRGEAQDLKTLTSAAKDVGYPLLIKAIAGGGGRGIRLVAKASALKDELESAVREAEAAFGDGRVMLEKLVEQPRHIEVQVFGDAHGNVVHLFERDCSLQRRRQKVLEEAPAPGMPDDVRAAMTDAAVKLAKAVKYEGAGTVEFIVDGSRPLSVDSFWFLEMNTRLQVEHPVTEMVTGTDLVEWQLHVAGGGELPLAQDEITLSGHAIEARICAEDPSEGFRPGAGLILEFGLLEPVDGEIIRWDTGFETGDRVPSAYDSMIAKLIVSGDDRDEAVDRLIDTLAHTQLVGVPSNAGFLRRCAMSDAFLDATHHVNWIAEQGDALTVAPEAHQHASVMAFCDVQLDAPGAAQPWDVKDGWRMNGAPMRKALVAVGGDADWIDPDDFEADQDLPLPLVTDLSPRRYAVTTAADSVLVEVPDYDADVEALLGGDAVKAPMPGKIIAMNVKPGDMVTRGDTLAVMEAMKMEHSLAAPRDGVVESVSGAVGEQVAEGLVLVQLVEEV